MNLKFPETFYRWRPHPWHGIGIGNEAPQIVRAYIELTPFDAVKYEVDKKTGYLSVDRPQRTSSLSPTLYGFIPRTYCDKHVAALSPNSKKGDGDPLDICVITERPISHVEIILKARVIGGLRMVDSGEADDKIVAVLHNDAFWKDVNDIKDVPSILQDRLKHYFLTYKQIPSKKPEVSIDEIYGNEDAYKVIEASRRDYDLVFGG
jgi:inorganic pyrophosphatase